MARRIKERKLKNPAITIIGEGATERFYFTHRLKTRHCPEDSGVPLLYTPQTSPLGLARHFGILVPTRAESSSLVMPSAAENAFMKNKKRYAYSCK